MKNPFRKRCKVCRGVGQVMNPKYKNIICFLPPSDYFIECLECNGTGKRLRKK